MREINISTPDKTCQTFNVCKYRMTIFTEIKLIIPRACILCRIAEFHLPKIKYALLRLRGIYKLSGQEFGQFELHTLPHFNPVRNQF